MKSILNYLALGLFIISHASCTDNNTSPGEPIVWYQYFAFVDEEGNDFFENNIDYKTINIYSPRYQTHLKFDDSLKIDGINIYGYGAFGPSTQYFSFGNGDIDTLTKVWEPASIGNVSASIDEVENITFLYNGIEIETWDFVQNPRLLNELKERNKNSIAHPTATNPIYIKITKKANPDEFD